MKAEITDLSILREVEVELKRFTKTLKNAIKARERDNWNANVRIFKMNRNFSTKV